MLWFDRWCLDGESLWGFFDVAVHADVHVLFFENGGIVPMKVQSAVGGTLPICSNAVVLL